MHGVLAGGIAAARPSGSAFHRVHRVRQSDSLRDDAILAEVRDVLGRPSIRAKNPAITDERVEDFLRRIDQVAQRINEISSTYFLPRDPDDEPYLNLALSANANYLVTWDKDMLDLMQDEGFRTQHLQLTILNPVALLQALTPAPGQQS